MPKHSRSAGAANRPQVARAIRDAVWEWAAFCASATLWRGRSDIRKTFHLRRPRAPGLSLTGVRLVLSSLT
jgi:hypothetical protein